MYIYDLPNFREGFLVKKNSDIYHMCNMVLHIWFKNSK
jgi:hypothetical protein